MEEYAFGNSTNTQTLANYITTFNNPRRNSGLVRFKIKVDGELTLEASPPTVKFNSQFLYTYASTRHQGDI